MSKAGATSANMKPANVFNAELHSDLNHRNDLGYVRHDLTHLNLQWHRYDSRSLPECFEAACGEYKKATGQKPQLGSVMRFDSKTKRTRKIEGFAPIREMVVVINDQTTESELDNLCKAYQDRFGMTPLAFSIHRDEGHWVNEVDERTGEVSKAWKPNLHAHLFFDVLERRQNYWGGKAVPDKKRGRTIKFTEKDMSLMQDMAAKALGMERGEKGAVRVNENIDEYKQKAKAEEYAQAVKEVNEKKAEKEKLVAEVADLSTTKAAKETAIESIKAVKEKATSLLGLGEDRVQKAKSQGIEDGRSAVMAELQSSGHFKFGTLTAEEVGQFFRNVYDSNK